MLNVSGERERRFLVSDFRGKASGFSPLSDVTCRFYVDFFFYQVEAVPPYSYFAETFYYE